MHIQTWRMVRGVSIPSVLLFIIGCAGEPVAPDAGEGPALGSVQSALVSCLGTGDVGAVRNAIAANCGGVAGCLNTTSTHDDLRLSNKNYCACYEWLWSQRNLAPFKNVQIFYHNAAAGQCGANFHIHVQKKTGNPNCSTTCNGGMQGLFHIDLDTSSAESATLCTNNDTRIDRSYNCSCTPIENKQSGACVNPL